MLGGSDQLPGAPRCHLSEHGGARGLLGRASNESGSSTTLGGLPGAPECHPAIARRVLQFHLEPLGEVE